MKNKQRKKAQRTINKNIRLLNKDLLKDSLWRGRFYFKQIDAAWFGFEDKSGGVLKVWIEARDLKTGLYYGFVMDNYKNPRYIWYMANKFIVEFSKVWDNIDEVKNDKTDWTKVKWIPKREVYR